MVVYLPTAILALLRLLGEKRWRMELEEVEELAETRGYQIIGEAIQTREKPDNATFFGSGKINQIKQKAEAKGADLIIVYNDLTSKQKLNIEQRTKYTVIDKYDLILEIFEAHAHDAISNLQIKLAKISRQVPYVRLITSKLHRGEKPFTRAGGEVPWQKKISDLRRRKKKIETKLEKRRNNKIRRIKSRKELGFVQACLVGYYNAGKTSLFNKLSKAEKPTSDRPFTTVQGKVSKIKGEILIVDTIGFVRGIKPEIIESFMINMEDIRHSEFLVLTVDVSQSLPLLNARSRAVMSILKNLGFWNKVRLVIANKIDLIDEATLVDHIEALRTIIGNQFPILQCSTKTGENTSRIKNKIVQTGQSFSRERTKKRGKQIEMGYRS